MLTFRSRGVGLAVPLVIAVFYTCIPFVFIFRVFGFEIC